MQRRVNLVIIVSLSTLGYLILTNPLCLDIFIHGKESFFYPLLTERDLEGFRKALSVFDRVCEGRVTYMLYAGSLLGSYRHHGFIPWDKDVDILVKELDKELLGKLLDSERPDFELTKFKDDVWRFCSSNASMTDSGYRWPYIDIFFYEEDGDKIWASYEEEVHLKYPKKDVFPLTKRPFMDLMLPSPNNYRSILGMKFDMTKCRGNSYQYKDIGLKCVVEVECNSLGEMFAFVVRKHLNKTHNIETLEFIKNSSRGMIRGKSYILLK